MPSYTSSQHIPAHLPKITMTIRGVHRGKKLSLTFEELELPTSITYGGAQAQALYQDIGGGRTAFTFGRDDAPIMWSGMLLDKTSVTQRLTDSYTKYQTPQGPQELTAQQTLTATNTINFISTAYERSKLLEELRDSGAQLVLSWGRHSFKIVLKDMNFVYHFPGYITYKAVANVIQTNPNTHRKRPQTLSTVAISMTNTFGPSVNEPWYSGLLGKLQTAMNYIHQFENKVAVVSQAINQAESYYQDVEGSVQSIITQAQTILTQITTLGGVIPDNPVALSVGNFFGKANAMMELAHLSNIQNAVGAASLKIGAGASYPPITPPPPRPVLALFPTPDIYGIGTTGIVGASGGTNDLLGETATTPGYTPGSGTYPPLFKNTNLASSGGLQPTSPITLTVANTTLFALAATYYGDAAQWPIIGDDNGISDPFIESPTTLTIYPLASRYAGGIQTGGYNVFTDSCLS